MEAQLAEKARQQTNEAPSPPSGAGVTPGASQDDIAFDQPLYAPHRKVYPQNVRGRFRTIKWVVLIVTLGIYYFLPFVRWDRGPNAPDQAVLIDFPGRRFYFFFIEIWPQEVYYFTGLLIVAAMALFLMNAVAGRIWCGYLCPQTVWTDLFLAVERLIEGDRRERILADSGPWTFAKVVRKTTKHFFWLMIAWWTGGAWVLYFADAPTLVRELASGTAPLIAYGWIGILTFTTYTLAGHMREQVCVYMCPWPRIQAALTDEYALNVSYRDDRGEPRLSVKQAALSRAKGEPAGDCIDCYQCVHVCPTGVDIRKGMQLDCIQCGLCIDACDAVMKKVDRATGLIGYDTEVNIERRRAGKAPFYRIVRMRTILYSAIIVLVGGIMVYTLATRSSMAISVLHDRNPQFVRLADGGVRNGYTVRISNKNSEPRRFQISVAGLPSSIDSIVGVEPQGDGRLVVEVGPDQTRELRILISDYHPERAASSPIVFHLHDIDSGERANAADHFRAP